VLSVEAAIAIRTIATKANPAKIERNWPNILRTRMVIGQKQSKYQ